MDSLKVFFLGKTQPYWRDLQERYQSDSPGRNYIFKDYFPENKNHFQSSLLEIMAFDPDILFLDYSSSPEQMLTMARTIKRCMKNFNAIIGLWDITVEQHLIDESNTTGVYINHIKSPELSDVIFQSITLSSDSPLDKKTYATVEYSEPKKINLSHLLKVGYITKDYVHLEHALILPSMGTNFKLQTSFHDQFLIDDFRLLRRIDKNFYYYFPHCSDVGYNFEDKSEEVSIYLKDEEKIQKQQQDNNEKYINEQKVKINNWITKNSTNNTPKRTRVLIVDPHLDLVKQATKPFDEYPFSIRLYTDLSEKSDEIKRIRPGIIAIQLLEEDDFHDLDILIPLIKAESDIDPFIIIFNCSADTTQLRKKYSDNRLIVNSKRFHIDELTPLCESYEKNHGRAKSHDQSISYAAEENRFYPHKSNPLSNAYLNLEADLIKINEAFISFRSPLELTKHSTFSIKAPTDFSVTILGEEKGYGDNCYWGVIHCISESNRKKLRTFINKSIQQLEKK